MTPRPKVTFVCAKNQINSLNKSAYLIGNCAMRDDKSYKASSELGEHEEGDEDASSVVSNEDEQVDPFEIVDDSPMDDETDEEGEWLLVLYISPLLPNSCPSSIIHNSCC